MDGSDSIDREGKAFRRVSRRAVIGWAAALTVQAAPLLYFATRRLRALRLDLTVSGPFSLDQIVKFAPTKSKSQFVTPERVVIREFGNDSVAFDVAFMFQGAEDPPQRVEVMLTARNSGGRILFRKTFVCKDQRLYARQNSGKLLGTGVGWFDPTNTQSFMLPASKLDKIQRVEVAFREIW